MFNKISLASLGKGFEDSRIQGFKWFCSSMTWLDPLTSFLPLLLMILFSPYLLSLYSLNLLIIIPLFLIHNMTHRLYTEIVYTLLYFPDHILLLYLMVSILLFFLNHNLIQILLLLPFGNFFVTLYISLHNLYDFCHTTNSL